MTAIIEISKGSRYKYEISKETGGLVLDRVLDISIPYSYGFIPGTLSEDGDPTDVFVLSSEPIQSLASVEIEPIALIHCKDHGLEDNKVVGVLKGDSYAQIDKISYHVDIIMAYLKNYKQGFVVEGWEDLTQAGCSSCAGCNGCD